MAFEKFLRSHLRSSEREGVSKELRDDVAGYVAQSSHFMRELSDQFSGQRSTAEHPHHKPKNLVTSFINSVTGLLEIRKEIDKSLKH